MAKAKQEETVLEAEYAPAVRDLSPFLRGRRPVNVNSIESITRDTDKLVTGTFVHVQYPGQSRYIHAAYYKDQVPFSQHLMDGEVYTLPLSVARHINERIFDLEHTRLTDPSGEPLKTGKKKHHTRFLFNELG